MSRFEIPVVANGQYFIVDGLSAQVRRAEHLGQQQGQRAGLPSDSSRLKEYLETRARARELRSILPMTVIPTMSCNFRCVYCSQGLTHRGRSLGDLAEKILAEVRSETRALDIRWFGGEPLLFSSDISRTLEEVSVFTEQRGIQLINEVVTNGSLVDDEVCGLISRFGVRRVQITIDGPADVHNELRPFADGRQSFESVMEGLERLLIKTDCQVVLRVNLSSVNIAETEALIQTLCRYSTSKLYVVFRRTLPFSGFEKTLSAQEFTFESIRLWKVCKRLGLGCEPPLEFRQHFLFCQAEMDGYRVVGNVPKDARCDFELDDNGGRVAFHATLRDKCLNCRILGFCGGGCSAQEECPDSVDSFEYRASEAISALM